jgi:hypothetical protein
MGRLAPELSDMRKRQPKVKWWLTIPGIIIGGLAFGLYLGFHSF